MNRISRISPIRRRAELRRAGILEDTGAFVLERLRLAGPILPDVGERWRRTALRIHEEVHLPENTRLWLHLGDPSQPRAIGDIGLSMAESAVVRGLLALGDPRWSAALAGLAKGGSSAQVRLSAYLLAHREAEMSIPAVDAMSLPAPYRQLALIRAVGANREEGIAAINTGLQELSLVGASWAAALAALEMARWHLGQGRLRMVFQLLSPFKEVDSWAIQWWMNLLFAEVYCRLERHDLSRNAIEQAIAVAPKPMSPVLMGELRMATARLLGASGESDDAEVQLIEARDAFRAAGDGIRLGRYLMAVGELFWQRGAFEDARGLFGKAIDLFRRYRDGIGLWEAQIKLGLVLNLAPANALISRS
jgi:tetratricopeptide (TPR) repeat protein